MMLPFCWNEFTAIPWQAYQPTDWVTLFLIVFAGTFLAYLFNVYGIRQLGASVAGAYIYVQPVFAAVIAAVVLHESLSVYKLLAAACIFVGVYLVTRKDKTTH
jgi:drug/metabolite transporter (DMT)-like permease